MSFSSLIGHDRPVAVLKRAIENEMLAHAYLFSGQEGVGKMTTALALAAAVNCLQPGPDGGCGVCPSCRRTVALTHPDIQLVMPESGNARLLATWSSKDVDKASDEIKIDQIREAQRSLSLKPSEGTKKVLLVDGADTLNDAAQNAFLKTLEEPSGDTLIVLVSARPQRLLPTIRSRCQELKFQPIPRNILARELTQRRGLSGEDAWFLAALAQGSMGHGLEMDVDQERSAREELDALWSSLPRMGHGELLTQADALAKDRERFGRLLDIGLERLRDSLVYTATQDERFLIHVRDHDRHEGRPDSVPRLLLEVELFTTSRNLLDRRVSAHLVAENLLFALARN